VIFEETWSPFPSGKPWSRFIQSTKTASIISIEKPVKFHPRLHVIHFPHYILSGQAGSSANRKAKAGWCNIRAIRWLRHAFESGNIQFLFGCPCRVNHCIVHMNQSHGFASFLGIRLHFLSEWTTRFFTKEW
jgi:hypothetical protein